MNRVFARLLRESAADDGLFFLAPIVLGLFLGGTAVAGATIYNADVNAGMVERANEGLTEQLDYVIEETDDAEYGRAKETNERARELREVVRDLKISEAEDYLVEVVTETGKVGVDVGAKLVGGPIDVAMDVFQAGSAVNDYSKIAQPTIDEAWVMKQKVLPGTIEYINKLNSVRFRATERVLEDGGTQVSPPIDLNRPVEIAVFDTKIDVSQRMVQSALPDLKAPEARAMAEEVMLDTDPPLVEAIDAAEKLKADGITMENYLKVA
ncbi:MAG: hypothetical protein C0418_05415, partial [Coriobacteriaceae bacterium]|nr:hypothetical protein [Coriobacteriaceae bacterium]